MTVNVFLSDYFFFFNLVADPFLCLLKRDYLNSYTSGTNIWGERIEREKQINVDERNSQRRGITLTSVIPIISC